MKPIDFLPHSYRQREVLRRARLWWLAVGMIFGAAIGSAALGQSWVRRGLARQLAELDTPHTAAQAVVRELSELHREIALAAQEASLFTYVEHPWPRTQLLAEVVRPLPPAIRLAQIHITEEALPQVPPQSSPRPQTAPTGDKLPPAVHDLIRLQEELDARETIILIDGHTGDVGSLHAYVAAVSRSSLVAAASIKSLETAPSRRQGIAQFTLRLAIRPGHGQRSVPTATLASN